MAPTTLAEPSALSAAPHAHVPTRTPMSAAQQTPSTLVLVVEDNPEDAALVKAAAERACPDVTFKFLSDGRHAVAYLAGHDEFADRQAHPLPHAVLLDVRLPGLDGFQVLEHIRQLRHCDHLKVLLWSSAFDHCVASWVKEAGAHDFVPKPSSFHQLTEHVRCLADLARAALNSQPSTLNQLRLASARPAPGYSPSPAVPGLRGAESTANTMTKKQYSAAGRRALLLAAALMCVGFRLQAADSATPAEPPRKWDITAAAGLTLSPRTPIGRPAWRNALNTN